MPHDAGQRGSPSDWLEHAKNDLAVSQALLSNDGILRETPCYHAQQAAEKALKAVLVSRGIEFPRTHNITMLIELLPVDMGETPALQKAVVLSDYAVIARYPSESEPIGDDELREAIKLAGDVLTWAAGIIESA